jgi:nucleoside-diphosphate-sugar epimerase
MNKPLALLAGFGQLNRAVLPQLETALRVVSLSRSPRPERAGKHIAVDLSIAPPEAVAAQAFDLVLISLSPDEFSEPAYDRTFRVALGNLLKALEGNPPSRLMLVSSTSVYHQSEGEWVDELSETRPTSFSGRCLLAAETLIREQASPATILRLSGIYGGQRTRLINQVLSGRFSTQGPSYYSNRIHESDAAAALAHLASLSIGESSDTLHDCYLISDSCPSLQHEVLAWLAGELGVTPGNQTPPSSSRRPGSKRCSNQRLLESGFRLAYPDYRAGYSEMLQRLNIRKQP